MSDHIRQGVDRLLATSFNDASAIDGAFGTRLGPAKELDGFIVQTAAEGTLAGVPFRAIELRRSADGIGAAVLLFSLADDGVAFDGTAWPGAMPQPPSTHAAGSTASWTLDRDGTSVVLGLDPSQQRLTRISIRKR